MNLASGTCPSVGTGGYLLGGGLGMLTNSLGPGSDSIIEMKMVSAKGDLLTINSVENADLFWALRGAGGGSFGIVTSFKVRIHEMINPVIYFAYKWTNAADPNSMLTKYSSWLNTVPSTITAYLDMAHSVEGENLIIEVYGVFLGTLFEAEDTIDVLLNDIRIAPNEDSIIAMPYINALLELSDINSKDFTVLADREKATEFHYYKGVGIFYPKPLSTETINMIVKFISASPNGIYSDISMQLISSENGRGGSKDQSDSAFIHGNQLMVLQVQTQWLGNGTNEPECEQCLSWSFNFVAALDANHRAEYPSEYVSYYQNYIDKNTKEWERGYYGDSFERLTTVKAMIDSDNMFQFPQSIPLTTTLSKRSKNYGFKSSSLFVTVVFISLACLVFS
jgi:hypothetical protein